MMKKVSIAVVGSLVAMLAMAPTVAQAEHNYTMIGEVGVKYHDEDESPCSERNMRNYRSVVRIMKLWENKFLFGATDFYLGDGKYLMLSDVKNTEERND